MKRLRARLRRAGSRRGSRSTRPILTSAASAGRKDRAAGRNATHMVAKELDAVNATACRRSELAQVRTRSTFTADHQNAGFGLINDAAAALNGGRDAREEISRPADQDEAQAPLAAAVLVQPALIGPPRARRC
jgi:hypothetical protein